METVVFRLVFASAWLISCIFAQKYSRSGFPYEKPMYTAEQVLSPIPLLTADAKLVSLSNLEINIPKSSRILLNNTGETVSGTVISGKEVTFTKGAALHDVYVLYQLNYRNNGVPNATESGVTEDSLGSAVTHSFNCYKKSYGSPQNALNHPDGFLVMLVQVLIVGNAKNPYFAPYENALYKVRKPYSTTIIRTEQAIYWLVKVLRNCPYYFVWPGIIFFNNPVPGRSDIIPGKQYAGATTIQIPRSCSPFLSYKQFYAYTSVKNRFNESTVAIEGLHPTNGRPIVQSTNGIDVFVSRRYD